MYKGSLKTCKTRARTRLLVLAITCMSMVSACASPVVPVVVPPRDERLSPVLAKTDFGVSVSHAVRGSPVLLASDAEIAAAQASVMAVRSDGKLSLQLGVDLAVSAITGGRFSNRSSPVIQVTQLLFDGGALKRRIKAAEINVARQVYLRDSAKATVALSAVEAAVLLVQAQNVSALAEDNVAEHRRVLSLVEESAQAGAGTEVDTLSARSELARANARLAAAKNARARASARYAEVFGIDPKISLFPPSAPALPAESDDTLIATSPRLRSLNAEIDAAEQLLAAQIASRNPPITIGIGVGLDPTTGSAAINAGISPRVDVLNGRRTAAQIALAEAEVARLQAERDTLARDIRRTLAVLRADRESGRATVTALDAAVQATAATVRATRDQLTTGRRDISQLLDAQRDQFEASEALETANATLLITEYAALALTGDILDVFDLTNISPPDPIQ